MDGSLPSVLRDIPCKCIKTSSICSPPLDLLDNNVMTYCYGQLLQSSQEQTTLPVKVKVKSVSRVLLFATPWTVAYQAPPSMGFSRQEYWSGLPFPSPGDLPDPGIESGSPALEAESFNLWATREAPWLASKFLLVIKWALARQNSIWEFYYNIL